MNEIVATHSIPASQVNRFRDRIEKLIQCCHTRTAYIAGRVAMNPAEVRSLMHFRDERYLTVKGLASKLDVAKSRVTKIIQGLVDKGYLESTPDPRDARIKLLSLTPAGRIKSEEIQDLVMSIHERILLELPSAELTTVLGSLDTLWTSMEMVKKQME